MIDGNPHHRDTQDTEVTEKSNLIRHQVFAKGHKSNPALSKSTGAFYASPAVKLLIKWAGSRLLLGETV